MELFNKNHATISKCTVSGRIVAKNIAGALVGHLYNDTVLKVDNCEVTAELEAEYTGAIVGYWANCDKCPVEIGTNVMVGGAAITAPTDDLFGLFFGPNRTYNMNVNGSAYTFKSGTEGSGGDTADAWT